MTSSFSDLQQLVHRFYYYLDERRYQDLVDLMRRDAVWHRQGKILRGREEVMAALNQRPASQVIRHVITNMFLDQESEGDVRLIAYLTAYKYDDGTMTTTRPLSIDAPFRFLLIKKHFVRDGGRWWIVESEGTAEFEFNTRK
jgi:hypothetical protein